MTDVDRTETPHTSVCVKCGKETAYSHLSGWRHVKDADERACGPVRK